MHVKTQCHGTTHPPDCQNQKELPITSVVEDVQQWDSDMAGVIITH